MRKIAFDVLVAVFVLFFVVTASSQSELDINAKVAQLDMDTATIDDVIHIFGEPEKYFWGGQTFTEDSLPSIYLAGYPNSFRVLISDGKVHELRFQEVDIGYVFKDKLRIGSSLDNVMDAIGQPRKTVQGQPKPDRYEDGVLYKDIDGEKGYCHYSREDHGIRLFFLNYKVKAIYVTSAKQGGSSETSKVFKGRLLQSIESVKEFDDVRWKDLSKLNLTSRGRRLITTLQFNQKTVWPKSFKVAANELLKEAMNPGLGIRNLHRRGITGKGVNLAIIDQPMYLDHPEFAGKIVEYFDTGCGAESSMHGPAVASLLVGTNCGTAPDARVYYAAAPSWKKDTAYEAKALDWIIQQNEKLPLSEKIRVVSVSAAPSGPGTPREKNQYMWDQACARAEAAGILVLDCTTHHGFIGPCWYDADAPESITRCKVGFPNAREFRPRDGTILVPSSPRTTAEEYDKGDCSYQYCGVGGLSWSIPYCAGVLALGWQLRPDIPPERMRELLFESAYMGRNGDKIINPGRFINFVKRAKVTPKS